MSWFQFSHYGAIGYTMKDVFRCARQVAAPKAKLISTIAGLFVVHLTEQILHQDWSRLQFLRGQSVSMLHSYFIDLSIRVSLSMPC